MRDPELVARAGYAAARLEQAWERWRALHGLGGSADPLASYVGYSLKEPMGQPRVVIGVDAAEAEFFADFLESHDCSGLAVDSGLAADVGALTGAGLTAGDPTPVNGAMHSQASGPMRPPVSEPMHPPVSGPQRVLANGAPRPSGPAAVSGPLGTGPLGADPAAAAGPLSPGPGAVPGAFGAGSADGAVARGSGPAANPASRNTGRPDLLSAPVGAEHPANEPSSAPAPVTRVFPAITADLPGNPGAPAAPLSPAAPNSYAEHSDYLRRTGRLGPAEYPAPGEPMSGPQEAPDAMAAELAGWASGELPGQASEQLASWVAGDSGGRRLRRSRSAR